MLAETLPKVPNWMSELAHLTRTAAAWKTPIDDIAG
jgi:hypothetical protein